MRGHCDQCGVGAYLSRGKPEPCACGGTVRAKQHLSNEVVRAGDEADSIHAAGTSEGARKGWENRHKLISDIHQHLHGGEGEVYSSSFSTGEGHPAGGGRQVSLLNAHGASDSNGHYSNDAVLTHFHDTGETHLDLHSSVHESAKKAGLIPEGSKLIRKPEGAGRSNFTYKLPSETTKASSAAEGDIIHCRAHASAAGSVLAEDSVGAFPLIYKPA